MFFLTGFIMGIVAFGMDKLEHLLVHSRIVLIERVLTPTSGLLAGWAIYAAFCVLCVFVAVVMSVYWGPGAIGSGVAETMGIVNGYNLHDFIGIKTLVTKIFGNVLAVTGGMKIGKEGPLAHIGSLIGVCTLYLPIGINTPFRNDRDKRAIIAAGAGVGVSVGFGAPIGGVLFAYEISRANAFWTFNLAWQTFLATSVANFTLTFLNAIATGHFGNVTNQGLIKFGDLSNNKYNLADMIIFAIIGILGGLIGALFIEINMGMARLRKRFIKTKPLKVIEALMFAFVGATMVYFLPVAFHCVPVTEATKEIGIQFTCPEQHINQMATLFFNT